MNKKTTTVWLKEFQKDLQVQHQEVHYHIQILDSDMFWGRIQNLEGFKVERSTKTGRA